MKQLLSEYNVLANIKSGLAVSLISLPVGLSMAVVSGVSPVLGIITAIWAGMMGALFGSSRYNILGPTGSLAGVLASFSLIHGPSLVPSLAVVAGIAIFLAYIFRLERYLIYIPSSAIHGFTLGVALIITLSQINFAFGLQNLIKHNRVLDNGLESLMHLHQASVPTLILFIAFFLGLLQLRRLVPSIPGALIAAPIGVIIGYCSTQGLLPFKLQTLGSLFGAIQPHLTLMQPLSFASFVFLPATIIALIAIIEAMLAAKIADVVTETSHNPRRELIGLALANIVSGLAGGLPASAALARTSFNIKAGATSSLSAFSSSLFFIALSFLLLPLFSYLPMLVIAAILITVALGMVERKQFGQLYTYDKTNFFISLVVAAITVYEDPIIGILAGSFIALLVLVSKIAQSHADIQVHPDHLSKEQIAQAEQQEILIYTFKGKLVYLNGQAHKKRFEADLTGYHCVILVLSDLYYVDLDGIDAFAQIVDLLRKRGQKVVLVRPTSATNSLFAQNAQFKMCELDNLVFNTGQEAIQACRAPQLM